jgi:uncharacterized membrane protein YcaP (DUF421 family)
VFDITLLALARILLAALIGYVVIVGAIRLAGKRALAKWNAFDFVVTIALGSSLSTLILSKQISIFEGLIGSVSIVFLQFVLTWLSVRIRWLHHAARGEPVLLLLDGQPKHGAMRRARVSDAELTAALRKSGAATFDEVHAVVLETDGNLSVISARPKHGRSTLEDVED